MNRKEKEALCEMMAQHEWGNNITTSSAAADVNNVIAHLKEIFKIAEDDYELMFARTWAIAERTKTDKDNYDYHEHVLHFMEGRDYQEGVVDFIEEHGFEKFRTEVLSSACED